MRNKLNKCCLTILILCSCTGLYAQDTLNKDIYLYKENRVSALYLKGPVKSSRWFYTFIKEDLSPQKKQRVKLENDIRNPFYSEFNPEGLLTKQIVFSKEYYDMPLDSGKVDTYNYNMSDLQIKNSYNVSYKHFYPVYDYYLLVKPSFDLKSKLFSGKINYAYKYKCNNNGEIVEELNYSHGTIDLADTDSAYVINEHDFENKVCFEYNNKHEVIKQTIKKEVAGMDTFDVFDTETPYCDDTQINYQYDDKGRVMYIKCQSCGKVIFEETYTYAPDGNYVTLVSTMFRAVNSFPTNRMTAHYNEYGDITQMDFIPSPRPSYLPPATTVGDNEPLHRYYDYDYDSHHNWIKCRLYLEGSKEGEPTAIAERKIEYYNEKD